jgi:hypothetical protein
VVRPSRRLVSSVAVAVVGSLARVLRPVPVLKRLRIRRARLTPRMRRGLRTIAAAVSRTARGVRRDLRVVVGSKSRDTADANDPA